MANKLLSTVVNGDRVIINSNAAAIDFLSIAINGLSISKTGSYLDFGASKLTNIAAGTGAGHAVEYNQLNTALGSYIPSAQKGAASGVASLDSGGKIPVGQLPNSVMEFKGVWNPSTNVPVLADSGAAVSASKVIADLTYTALAAGLAGNSISIQYVGDGAAGAETVSHVGTAFVVHMDPTAITGSTATQIKAAIDADVGTGGAATLVSVAITGTAGNVQAVQGPSALLGGQDPANIGDIYRASTAGSHNFGSGAITFAIGDWVMYSGSVWQKSQASDVSVDVLGTLLAGFSATTGTISSSSSVLTAFEYLEYRTALNDAKVSYSAGTARSDLIETATITDGETTKAPCSNLVFDALAGKSDTGHNHSGVYDPAGTAAGLIEDAIVDGITTKAPSQNAVFDALALKADASAISGYRSFTNDNAGAITIRQVAYVKSNGHVDLAKADVVATGADVMLVIVKDASIAASSPGNCYYKSGEIISGFTSLTISANYFVSAAAAGALVTTPPSATGNYVYKVGRAISGTELLLEPEYRYSFE